MGGKPKSHRHILAGAWDLHIHTAPDISERIGNDDVQLLKLAKREGFEGIVIKNHFFLTEERATIKEMMAEKYDFCVEFTYYDMRMHANIPLVLGFVASFIREGGRRENAFDISWGKVLIRHRTRCFSIS